MSNTNPIPVKLEFDDKTRKSFYDQLGKSLNRLAIEAYTKYGVDNPDISAQATQVVIDQADKSQTDYYNAEQAYQRRFGKFSKYDPKIDTPESDQQLVENLRKAIITLQEQIKVVQAQLEKLNPAPQENVQQVASSPAPTTGSSPSSGAPASSSPEIHADASSTASSLSSRTTETVIAPSSLPAAEQQVTSSPEPVTDSVQSSISSSFSLRTSGTLSASQSSLRSSEDLSFASSNRSRSASAASATSSTAGEAAPQPKTSLWRNIVSFFTRLITGTKTPSITNMSSYNITPDNPTYDLTHAPDPLSRKSSFSTVTSALSSTSGNKAVVASQTKDDVEESEKDKLLKKISEFNAKVDNFITQYEKPFTASVSTVSALIGTLQESTLTKVNRDSVEASFMSEAVSDSKRLVRATDTEIAKLTDEKESLMNEVESFRAAQGKVDKSITKELSQATQKLDAAVARVTGMKELLKGEDINLNSNVEQTTPPPSFRQ